MNEMILASIVIVAIVAIVAVVAIVYGKDDIAKLALKILGKISVNTTKNKTE